MQIDKDPTRIGKTFDVHVGLVGDGHRVLEKLVPLIEEKEANEDFCHWIIFSNIILINVINLILVIYE